MAKSYYSTLVHSDPAPKRRVPKPKKPRKIIEGANAIGNTKLNINRPITDPIAPANPFAPIVGVPGVSASAPISASPSINIPTFDQWKLTQPDYVANTGDLQARRNMILTMLGGIDDPASAVTTYGQLNNQFQQNLGASRQGAANAGIFTGGALNSLKQGNLNTLERGRFAAKQSSDEEVRQVDKAIADQERISTQAYNDWLAENAPSNATPAEVSAAVTPDQKVVDQQWDNDANAFANRAQTGIEKTPLQTIKAITAYLNDNGKNLSPLAKRKLVALRETAYARYYKMTRGK